MGCAVLTKVFLSVRHLSADRSRSPFFRFPTSMFFRLPPIYFVANLALLFIQFPKIQSTTTIPRPPIIPQSHLKLLYILLSLSRGNYPHLAFPNPDFLRSPHKHVPFTRRHLGLPIMCAIFCSFIL